MFKNIIIKKKFFFSLQNFKHQKLKFYFQLVFFSFVQFKLNVNVKKNILLLMKQFFLE